MNRVKKFFIFVLFFSSLLFNNCEDKIKPTVISSINSSDLPSQESWNTTVTFSDSGRVVAILKAGYVRYYEIVGEYQMSEKVKVDFFNKTGEHSSILTSEKATIDNKTKNMIASENVVVVSDSGVVVKTEQMRWINLTKRISGDQFVTITSNNEKISGYGFESDQSLKDYVIKKVTGIVAADKLMK